MTDRWQATTLCIFGQKSFFYNDRQTASVASGV